MEDYFDLCHSYNVANDSWTEEEPMNERRFQVRTIALFLINFVRFALFFVSHHRKVLYHITEKSSFFLLAEEASIIRENDFFVA